MKSLKDILIGNTPQSITVRKQLEVATSSEISFIGNQKYEKLWKDSNACVAVVNEDISIEPGKSKKC